MQKQQDYNYNFDKYEQFSSAVSRAADLREKDSTEATQIIQQVFDKLVKLAPSQPEIPDYLWREVGTEFYLQKNYKLALTSFTNALAQARKYLGEENQIVGGVLADLAMVHEEMGDNKLAENLYEQSLVLRSKYYDANDRVLQWRYQKLADIRAKL